MLKKRIVNIVLTLVFMLTLLPANQARAAENIIPDPNFKAAVLEILGRTDGDITAADVKDIKRLDVRCKNISSLAGIEYFTALTYLNCENNQLTALGVSRNTALTELWCVTNELTSFRGSSKGNLASILEGLNDGKYHHTLSWVSL